MTKRTLAAANRYLDELRAERPAPVWAGGTAQVQGDADAERMADSGVRRLCMTGRCISAGSPSSCAPARYLQCYQPHPLVVGNVTSSCCIPMTWPARWAAPR